MSHNLRRPLTRYSLFTTRIRNFSSSHIPPNNPNDSPDDPAEWKKTLTRTREQLRLWGQIQSAALKERTESLSSNASVSLQTVGVKLNEVTGYHEIEALKKQVVDTEKRIAEMRDAAKDAKTSYERAVAERFASQREVNELLQRKSSWTEADVLRFTTLVRQDHTNEQAEASAKIRFATSEGEVEREFNELMRAILSRYHEEQVWSDKIRSASTYGSLLALGLNVVVFILAIIVVEPYKRRRLAATFEKRIEEISRENKAMIEGGMASLTQHFKRQEEILSQLAEIARQPPITVPETTHPPEEDEGTTEMAPIPPPTRLERILEADWWPVATIVLGGLVAMAAVIRA